MERPKDLHEAMNRERDISRPFAGIQWKGTSVCMDVSCNCGAAYHIDGDFVYFVKCPGCGRTFYCGTRIELIEMGAEQEMVAMERPKMKIIAHLPDEIRAWNGPVGIDLDWEEDSGNETND